MSPTRVSTASSRDPVSRNSVDRLADAWHTSRHAIWTGAGLALLAQLVLTAFSSVEELFPSAWVWAGWIVLQTGSLLLRRRWPLPVLVLQCLLMLAATLLYWAGDYCWFPLLIAAYSVARRCAPLLVGIGFVLAVLAAVPMVQAFRPGRPTTVADFIPVLFYVGFVMAVALGFRWRRQLVSSRIERAAAAAEARQARERQHRAERASRIANDLHDSVGHNLTAIIALTEGLTGITNDRALDEPLTMINELAREALEDTRTVVTAIHQGPDIHPTPGSDDAELHTWDDVFELIERVRATGLAVAVTEVGTRPETEQASDTSFIIVREALTNLLRHASGASRAVIAFEHRKDWTRVTVTDNGEAVAEPSVGGNGIRSLRRRLEMISGTVDADSSEAGWRISADFPNAGTDGAAQGSASARWADKEPQ